MYVLLNLKTNIWISNYRIYDTWFILLSIDKKAYIIEMVRQKLNIPVSMIYIFEIL